MAFELVIPESIYDITFVYVTITYIIVLLFFLHITWRSAPKYHFAITKANMVLAIVLFFLSVPATLAAVFDEIQPIQSFLYFLGFPIGFFATFVFSVSLISAYRMIRSKTKFTLNNQSWKSAAYGLLLLNGITTGIIQFFLILIWGIVLSY